MTAIDSAEDRDPARWRMLALLACAELLGMSLWFAGSAVAPELSAHWQQLADRAGAATDVVKQASWLTTIVQLGFVLGTAVTAVLNLADVLPTRWFFATCAVLGAAANLGVAYADGFAMALGLRLATGFFLAGVYPPAMKMASTWFRSRRGLAIGTIVGALTIGKATPYLLHAMPHAGPTMVLSVASGGAVIAALLVALLYSDGPYPFPSRRFSWGLVSAVFERKEWRLATGGYLGHMFELYSFWTWIPLFLAASTAASGYPTGPSAVSAAAFGTIAVGGLGCVWGGLAADRRGREWLVSLAMAASGLCCLLVPFVFGTSLWVASVLAWVWGFFVIADSAQFSALVTESVPPHAVGTALTVQTSIGFLLTMVSIQLIPPLVDVVGWKWAFPILALGPICGIASIRRLVRFRAAAAGAP